MLYRYIGGSNALRNRTGLAHTMEEFREICRICSDMENTKTADLYTISWYNRHKYEIKQDGTASEKSRVSDRFSDESVWGCGDNSVEETVDSDESEKDTITTGAGGIFGCMFSE